MSELNRLIVALGNPGNEYVHTRHNIAWEALGFLENSIQLIWKEKFNGHFASINKNDEKIYFLRPYTFMNLSGKSVQPLTHYFKVKLENILVVHDEIDMPFGTLSFKKGGGLAGHNGLKSIAQCMGGNNFFWVNNNQ